MTAPSSKQNRPKQNNTRELGAFFEAKACAFILHDKGWRILAQNWRYGRTGEIDLIALDDTNQTLHIIEVKARQGMQTGSPLEALTPAKQAQLKQLAEHYWGELQEQGTLAEYNIQHVSMDVMAYRFDIGFETSHSQKTLADRISIQEADYLENAF